MAAETDDASLARLAGTGLHLLAAVAAALLVVGIPLTVANTSARACSFPTFEGQGCWGMSSVLLSAAVAALSIVAATRSRSPGRRSRTLILVADVFTALVGGLFVVRGYGSFQLLGFVLLAASAAGLALSCYPAVAGRTKRTAPGQGTWPKDTNLRRTVIGLHLVTGGAAAVGVLGMVEPVLSGPAGVCGVLALPFQADVLAISYPCYPLLALLHPAAAGLAAFAAAGILRSEVDPARPAGILVGILAIPSGLLLVYGVSALAVLSGLVLFGAGAGTLTLAFHPALDATDATESVADGSE